ncbi:hypothetical protein [Neisseria perflava]|uniref:hypothetical protein n=1 Tax=Neisseria perflava TaxID=33053 RepID=UPI00209DC83C|nr:hypothetical protein [Neisseria perflava]MCP1660531.1 hypothetical protein [Neisseria perflava]
MSKLTKLLTNPKLFFQDAISNKNKNNTPIQLPPKEVEKTKTASVKNSPPSKPKPVAEKPAPSKSSVPKPSTEKSKPTEKATKPATPKPVAEKPPQATATKPTQAKAAATKPSVAKPVEKSVKTPEKTAMPPVEKPVTRKTDALNPFKKIAHVIHTGEGMTHGPSHLSQWIPYFIQSNENFAVLVRNMDLYKWVRENYPQVDVIYAKNPIDVEGILSNLAFVKAIYYLSNTGNMIHTLRFNVYKHIFLGHGDSDKSASAHKFFRVYDEVWVAGQAHIDRFKNAGFNTAHMTFVKIGRPMLADIIKQTQTPWDKRSEPRILYLPTWEGVYEEGNYSSVRMASTMLSEIYKRFGMHLSMKFHPVTGSRDKMLGDAPKKIGEELQRQGTSFYIADKLTPVSHLIMNANIYICDISAVVSECIAANGPLFAYIPKDKEIKISQSDMTYSDYAYTFSNIEELLAQLERVLGGDDYKKEQRIKAMDYLLSTEQTLHDEFAHQLKVVADSDPLKANIREIIVQ